MTLKVLPLERWLTDPMMLSSCLGHNPYVPVDTRFNRPGVYLDKGVSWLELGDNLAYSFPVSDFTYRMALLEAERLNARQAAALHEISAQRLATREQLRLLRHYQDAMSVRHTYRMALKYFLLQATNA